MRPPAWVLRAQAAYHRAFHIEEIERAPILQWAYGGLLFFFFVSFQNWISSTVTTVATAQRGAAICWPYFQSCYKLYFLQGLPYGYSQTEFYMGLYGLMLLAVWFMYKKQWVYAHALMVLFFAWKMFVGFVLSYLILGPYDYYHLILTAIFLFVPLKEYFLKLAFVVFYFVSATIKIDPTWTFGTYFTAMKTGLPIFPNALTLFFTNLVIFMQIVGAWFLLSKRPLLQRGALLYFVIFHLYSGILVYYVYPSITLPMLLILFGPFYRYTPPPFGRRSIAGWAVIAGVLAFQFMGFWVSLPSDRRLTLEGNRYGMFMFEANHQGITTVKTYRNAPPPATPQVVVNNPPACTGLYCVTQTKTYGENGLTVEEKQIESPWAWNRFDPYVFWAEFHLQCSRDASIVRIAMTVDHSINGGPFYRIVDVPNICNVSYSAFSNNTWIVMPPQAPIVGYPVQNYYTN